MKFTSLKTTALFFTLAIALAQTANAQKVTSLRMMEAKDGLGKAVFSYDGKTAAFFGWAGPEKDRAEITIWNTQTGAVKRELKQNLGQLSSIALSTDGKTIALGYNNKINFLSIQAGKVVRTLSGHSGNLKELIYSPDGKMFASRSDNKTTRVWNLSTGKSQVTIAETPDGGYAEQGRIAFSPNSKTIATAGTNTTIKLWDVKSGKLLRALPKADIPVTFSGDGKTLATSSREESNEALKIWDIKTGKLKRSLTFRSTNYNFIGANTVALSPNGKLLAAYYGGGGDWGQLRLWNTTTGKFRVFNQTEGDGGIAFSPDGKNLVVSDWGGTVSIFKLG